MRVMQCVAVLYYCVCVSFRRGRNNRPRSGKHQAEAFGFFLVLEWEEGALSCVISTLPRNLKHKPRPADSPVTSICFYLHGAQDGCVLMNQNNSSKSITFKLSLLSGID